MLLLPLKLTLLLKLASQTTVFHLWKRRNNLMHNQISISPGRICFFMSLIKSWRTLFQLGKVVSIFIHSYWCGWDKVFCRLQSLCFILFFISFFVRWFKHLSCKIFFSLYDIYILAKKKKLLTRFSCLQVPVRKFKYKKTLGMTTNNEGIKSKRDKIMILVRSQIHHIETSSVPSLTSTSFNWLLSCDVNPSQLSLQHNFTCFFSFHFSLPTPF